jgi:hypothetical protein
LSVSFSIFPSSCSISSLYDQSLFTLSESHISKALFAWARDADIDPFLCALWAFLLETASAVSPSAQAATWRSARLIVCKLAAAYPARTMAVIRASAAPAKAPAFMIDLIADLGPALGAVILDGIDAAPWFLEKQASVFESAPIAIEKLHFLGRDWFRSLMISYLRDSNLVRPQYRAVCTILKLFPDLAPLLYSDGVRDFSLIAFVFSTLGVRVNNLPFISELFRNFMSTISIGEIDACLEILGSLTDVSVECTKETVVFGADGQRCEISFTRSQRRSKFYCLDLPLELLAPLDGDDILILIAKFSRLAFRAAQSFHFFDEFVSKPYHQFTSAAMQSLPNCINDFGAVVDQPIFRRFVTKVLFTSPSSWMHAQEIVTVLKALDPKYFDLIGGCKSVISLCNSFLLNRHESVTLRAQDALLAIGSRTDPEMIFEF